jgi:Domain of unknown function (DUF4303)
VDQSEESLLTQLQDALCRAFRDAVAYSQAKHPGDRFYSYVLYTTPLFESATLTFNTEEALAQAAQANPHREELRWTPAEWAYDEAIEAYFNPADQILNELLRLPDAYKEERRDRRWQTFVKALQSLDSEDLFGTGEARDSVFVNIMWGDQDLIAHVESARQLNPRVTYLRYAAYALPGLFSKEKEIRHSRSMYREESLARIRRVITQVEQDLGKRS